MKGKFLTLCLAAALAVGVVSCGKTAGNVTTDAEPSVDPQEIAQQQAEYTPNGTVLVDGNGLKITVDDLRQDDSSIELELIVENSSLSERTISVASCSVNGYMAGSFFICTVPAQDSVQEAFFVYMDELAELGVTDLADVTITFNVDDSSGGRLTLTSQALTMPRAALYDYAASPLQMAMSDPDWLQENGCQVLHATAEPLYDQDGVSLSAAYVVDGPFGHDLRLELTNTAAQRSTVELGRIALNGVELSEPNYALYSIDPGKRYLVTIGLDFLIPDSAQEDYAQLQEVGFALNGVAVQLPLAQ